MLKHCIQLNIKKSLGSKPTHLRICLFVLSSWICVAQTSYPTFTKPLLRLPAFLDLGSCLDAFIPLFNFSFMMVLAVRTAVWTCQNSVSFLPNPLWKPSCPLAPVSMGLAEGPREELHCPSVRLQGTKTAKEESLLWKFGFLGSID